MNIFFIRIFLKQFFYLQYMTENVQFELNNSPEDFELLKYNKHVSKEDVIIEMIEFINNYITKNKEVSLEDLKSIMVDIIEILHEFQENYVIENYNIKKKDILSIQ